MEQPRQFKPGSKIRRRGRPEQQPFVVYGCSCRAYVVIPFDATNANWWSLPKHAINFARAHRDFEEVK